MCIEDIFGCLGSMYTELETTIFTTNNKDFWRPVGINTSYYYYCLLFRQSITGLGFSIQNLSSFQNTEYGRKSVKES